MPSQPILSFIDGHRQEQLRFVMDLCNQNSYVFNKPGTDKVAEMVIDHLAPILTAHKVFAQSDVGDHHVLRNHTGPKTIYLLGHLDTVFAPNHPFQKCRLEKERLYGPGTCDMKGGIAVIVYALKALHATGKLARIDVAVILGADEENGSVTSQSIYEDERTNAAICLAAECAGPQGEVVLSRNGKMGARVDCYGEDRHVSAGTHEKASAVLELAHQIIALESLNASLPGASTNVGKVEGGLGPSTVPGRASALLDIRWVDEEHRAKLDEAISLELPRRSLPGCHSTFTILNSRPAMPLVKDTEALFQRIRALGRTLGQIISAEHRRGTSDANYFGATGVPTIDGLGPVGFNDHTAEEHILTETLAERTALLAHVLMDLSRRPHKGS